MQHGSVVMSMSVRVAGKAGTPTEMVGRTSNVSTVMSEGFSGALTISRQSVSWLMPDSYTLIVVARSAIAKNRSRPPSRIQRRARSGIEPNRGTVARWSEAVEGADLVVIATPPSQHVTDVMAALDVGARWLLVEKPLATSAAEADGLQHAALAAGAHVYVGYCLRFALATLQLKDAIARIAP